MRIAKTLALLCLFTLGLASAAGGSPTRLCRTTTVYVTTTVKQVSTVISTVTQTVTNTVTQTVTQPGTTTEPPPPSAGGWGLIQLGDTLSNIPLAEQQAAKVVIVSPDDAPAAAALPGRSLVYVNATCIAPNGGGGLDYNTAQSLGYLTGVNSTDYNCTFARVDNSGYQQWAGRQVVALVQSSGVDGVFLDDDGLSSHGLPYTPDQMRAAMPQLTAALGSALHAQGKYLLAGANAYYPGNPTYNDGTADEAWWETLAPYVDGIDTENWMETSEGSNTLRLRGTDSWMKLWDEWMAQATKFHAAFPGVTHYGLSYGDDAHLIYGRASLMIADPTGVFLAHRLDDSDPAGPWMSSGTPSVDPVAGTARIG